MKGITLCADCAYYDLKKHKCNRGATVDPDMSKGQDVRFYVDCPLDDVEPVRHWIPCSERLPENDAKCLVYTSDKRVCMARWYGKYDEQGAWYIISDEVPKLYRIKNVPFWMPLPEPPKEV